MKKVLLLVVSLLMILSVAGCTSKEETPAATTETPATTEASAETPAEETGLQTIKDGVLMVGMQVDYPPFEMYAEDGITPVGLDCDIIEAIAADMGLEVEYVDTAWDGIFAGLDTNKYDTIISGVTITAEREEKYDFTQSYIQNYQCMVEMKDGEITAKSPEEAGGLRVAYQAETTSDIYVTELVESGIDIDAYEYEKILECFAELEAGRVDAIVCDSTVTFPYINKENSPFEVVWTQDEAPEEFGIMVKSGNAALLTALDDGLTKLKSEGTLDSFMMKWFSE
ncbi:MAG: polar amino acid transport system substrate-binding protein [Clostridiales bacterium]|nr:polar amino acid transport system substrate-binding protein [Clostridiales bacterium]